MQKIQFDEVQDYIGKSQEHENPKTVKVVQSRLLPPGDQTCVRAVTFALTHMLEWKGTVSKDDVPSVVQHLKDTGHVEGKISELTRI